MDKLFLEISRLCAPTSRVVVELGAHNHEETRPAKITAAIPISFLLNRKGDVPGQIGAIAARAGLAVLDMTTHTEIAKRYSRDLPVDGWVATVGPAPPSKL